MTHPTLDEWIAREAIPLSVDSPDAAIDTLAASLGDAVELLGFGEALHGSEEMLLLRNRLFQRLVTAHGYRAIAIESSFPRGRVANAYVAGRGPASYEEVQEAGFGHGFGKLEANRELVEWMRRYNADPSHPVKLRFYGFDIPSSPTGNASPRQVLRFAVDYLASIDSASGQQHRQRIEGLLGQDFDWEDPATYADHTKSVGLSPAAAALRIATEDLITELRTRHPELVGLGDASRYAEALQHARIGREQLNYHAALARGADIATLLGIRDALMADNLAYTVERERGRGKVLAFAHNAHLQRGRFTAWATWQKALGKEPFSWWPAGAHLHHLLGPRYAVIGSAVGVSEANGIAAPEAGTLEARLTAAPGAARLIPTHQGRGLPTAEVAALPNRCGSMKNLSYVPLTAQSFTDFDWLAVFNSTAYNRGGPPLQQPDASPGK
jgi:erythromycin esterase-like protein